MFVRIDGGLVVAATFADQPDGDWLEVQATTRPADTITTTWDEGVGVIDGQPVQTWSERPWTAEELAAMSAARLAALRASTNAQTLRDRLLAALATNQTYLARTSPTTAQNTAQVKALTSQTSSLVRLALGLLDSTN